MFRFGIFMLASAVEIPGFAQDSHAKSLTIPYDDSFEGTIFPWQGGTEELVVDTARNNGGKPLVCGADAIEGGIRAT